MPNTKGFARSHAVVIGVDNYRNGVPPLRTAVSDAATLAALLEKEHGYEVRLLTDEAAGLAALSDLLDNRLPAAVGPDDRLLFYFAGHGIATDGDDGPVGYLLPQDVRGDDPGTFLEMTALQAAINRLGCRHLLVLLDCCFAGAFRWSSTRQFRPPPAVVHRERYERYLIDEAWQVITSAAHNQEARDVIAGSPIGNRGEGGGHSPFARALLDALRGAADLVPAAHGGRAGGDGVITATELYAYLRERIELESIREADGTLRQRQTPGLWMLNKHRGGEYIFLVPGRPADLPPAPQLSPEDNPYRGLGVYEERHRELFFGRERAVEELSAKVAVEPLAVVLGASGTGKSSLVRAGLMPRLRGAGDPAWHVLPALRPGADPVQNLFNLLGSDADFGPPLAAQAGGAKGRGPASLTDLVAAWRAAHPGTKLLLVVDQLEELITLRRDEAEAVRFQEQLADAVRAHGEQLRVLCTLRSDFEPHFTGAGATLSWEQGARFVVPPLSRAELREAVLKPAEARVLYFDPPELVEKLVDEVAQMPGALPLLSFTLSEMYANYISQHARDDRALTEENYVELGGVIGSLRHRATGEYERLDEPRRKAMRSVLLRMVAVEGREVTRRRVPKSELTFAEPEVNEHVTEVLGHLSAARLISEGQEADDEPYAEPAHDALVAGWDRLRLWIREERDTLVLQRRLTQAARDWAADRNPGRLWDDDPRLPQARQLAAARGKLNRIEADFVRAAVARVTRRRRQRVGAAAAAFVAVAAVAAVFYFQRNAAVKQQFVSLAQALAAESLDQPALNRQDERATLLALQAYHFNRRYSGGALSQVDAALRAAVGVKNFSNILPGTPATRGSVRTVIFSPDGRWLAAGSGNGPLLLWDLNNRGAAPFELNGHEKLINALAFSPDGRTLASASLDGTIRLWDVARRGGGPRTLARHTDKVTCLAFSRDGGRMASGSFDGTVLVWDMSRLEDAPAVLRGHWGTPSAAVFSPDGRTLAYGTNDDTFGVTSGQVWAWDLAPLPAGPARAVGSRNHHSGVVALKFDPDNRTVIIVGAKTPLSGWVTTAPQQYGDLEGFPKSDETVASGSFSTDGTQLVTGTEGGLVRVRGMRAGDPELLLRGHRKEVNSVAFSPDGKRFASAGDDDIIRLWSLEPPPIAPESFREREFSRAVRQLAVAFDGDGRSVLAGDSNGVIRRWESGRGKTAGETLKDFRQPVAAVAWSPDGKLFAKADPLGFSEAAVSAFEAHVVKREQPDAPPVTLDGHVNEVWAIAFVPNSNLVATGSLDKTIRLWDLSRPQPSENHVVLKGHAGGVMALAVSPDGRLLASGGADRTVQLWDLRDPKKSATLGSHDGEVTSLRFSSDARLLASGGDDRTARVWNVAEPQRQPLVLRGHDQTVKAVAFSPDGRTLVTGSYDGTTRLWDLQRPEVAPLIWNSANGEVVSVAFSPDGTRVASGYVNGRILVWVADPASVAGAACGMLRRNLSAPEWWQFVGADVPYEKTCEELPPGDTD